MTGQDNTEAIFLEAMAKNFTLWFALLGIAGAIVYLPRYVRGFNPDTFEGALRRSQLANVQRVGNGEGDCQGEFDTFVEQFRARTRQGVRVEGFACANRDGKVRLTFE